MFGDAVSGVPLPDRPVLVSKPDWLGEPDPSASKPEYPIKSLIVNNGFSNFEAPVPTPVNNC